MKVCKKCGCATFTAHQVCHLDVLVDGDNQFEGNANGSVEKSIYSSDHPFGPYTCRQCGAEYDDLNDLPDVERPPVVQTREQIAMRLLAGALTHLKCMKDGSLADADWPDVDRVISDAEAFFNLEDKPTLAASEQSSEFCLVVVTNDNVLDETYLFHGHNHEKVARDAEEKVCELARQYGNGGIDFPTEREAMLDDGYVLCGKRTIFITWPDVRQV